MNYLEKLKKTCAAATPGPWAYNMPVYRAFFFIKGQSDPFLISDDEVVVSHGDAAFIAEARVALPRLIEAVEALSGGLEKIEKMGVRFGGPSPLYDHQIEARAALARAQALLEGEWTPTQKT